MRRAFAPLGPGLVVLTSGGAGIRPSAPGYYQDGQTRWRVAALVRPDAEFAKDVMSTLEHQADARRIEKLSKLRGANGR